MKKSKNNLNFMKKIKHFNFQSIESKVTKTLFLLCNNITSFQKILVYTHKSKIHYKNRINFFLLSHSILVFFLLSESIFFSSLNPHLMHGAENNTAAAAKKKTKKHIRFRIAHQPTS